jgi:quinol monooxygenase YgiN
MINVIATITVKTPHMNTFIEIFKSNIPNVLNEKGCLEYAATVDFVTDIEIQEIKPNTLTVIEKWESYAHLQEHLAAAHMLEFKDKVKDILESVSLKVLESV